MSNPGFLKGRKCSVTIVTYDFLLKRGENGLLELLVEIACALGAYGKNLVRGFRN